MKLRVPQQMLEQIRATIINKRAEIQHNREHRKQLIRDIRTLKHNIKAGENLCSKLEVGLVCDVAYLRADLKNKRDTLATMRTTLLGAEIDHSISKAMCRVLHEQLDRLNAPFDPSRATSAGRSRS
jgi:hypothetical protein